jgi:hypothetical protein
MAQAVSPRPHRGAQVNPVEFVVDKVALGQVFSPSPSVFPLSISFYRGPYISEN